MAKIVRSYSTPESRAYWEATERSAAAFRALPAWQRRSLYAEMGWPQRPEDQDDYIPKVKTFWDRLRDDDD